MPMSAIHKTSNNPESRFFAQAGLDLAKELALLAGRHPGRSLFATRFSPEDQIVAHLIFKYDLPVRVFTFSGAEHHDILIRSVDSFRGTIEVSFHQARQAAAEFTAKYPEIQQEYEKNPGTAPLGYVLQGHHLLITGQRKQHLAASYTNPASLEWDEAGGRAVFHPLYYWTDEQVSDYIRQNNIPHYPEQIAVPAAAAVPPQDHTLRILSSKRTGDIAVKSKPVADVFNAWKGRQFFGLLE